jgi:lysozyme family protein
MISDWDKAYQDMLKFEGGYANHPNDRGGETFRGISRNVWGRWKGWKILDEYKKMGITTPKKLNEAMFSDKRVEPLVEEFYKQNFWRTTHGDDLPSKLSRKVFDTAVNMGVKWGILLLQKSLNHINEHINNLFEELKEDGIYGKNTNKALQLVFKKYGKNKGQELILDWYCEYQAERYNSIVSHNSSQKVFLKGWLRRAKYKGE